MRERVEQVAKKLIREKRPRSENDLGRSERKCSGSPCLLRLQRRGARRCERLGISWTPMDCQGPYSSRRTFSFCIWGPHHAELEEQTRGWRPIQARAISQTAFEAWGRP